MGSSIEDKTVRPGSFLGYAYYHSNRQQPMRLESIKPKQHHVKARIILIGLLLVIIGSLLYNGSSKPTSIATQKTAPATSLQPSHVPAATAILNTPCSSNASAQLIVVSISARKLWACQANQVSYTSPVITGMSAHPDTITPLGNYQIYAKTADTTLTGSDSTGSWSDPVSYWMPFLSNQYGVYGLHDATWRSNNVFGNVDPTSSNASHGCVELPLATSKWIYNWVQAGTTVSIKS